MAHDPCDRILKRRARIGTIRHVGKTWNEKREIPGSLNDIVDAPIQHYIRRIRDCAERGQLYTTIDGENIRVSAMKYPRPSYSNLALR